MQQKTPRGKLWLDETFDLLLRSLETYHADRGTSLLCSKVYWNSSLYPLSTSKQAAVHEKNMLGGVIPFQPAGTLNVCIWIVYLGGKAAKRKKKKEKKNSNANLIIYSYKILIWLNIIIKVAYFFFH